MKIICFITATIVIFSTLNGFGENDLPESGALARVDKETKALMRFRINEPFNISLGRGSGFYGLSTVSIDPQGRVVVYRWREKYEDKKRSSFWETAVLTLSRPSIIAIGKAVQEMKLLQMEHRYHADIQDGTQWVFLLRQGQEMKSTYFNNYFPEAILRFAEFLDHQLNVAGLQTVQWVRVENSQAAGHDRELWESIQK